MFYCVEILQRRSGSFGVIWLAATQSKRLTKREYEMVKVAEKCDEIIDYINLRKRTHGDVALKFSLYLSSQLMYGTAKVHLEQEKHLLTACSNLQRKVVRTSVLEAHVEAGTLTDKKLCITSDLTDAALLSTTAHPQIRNQATFLELSDEMLMDVEPFRVDPETGSFSAPHTARPEEITLRDPLDLLTSTHAPGTEMELPAVAPVELEDYFREGPTFSPVKAQHIDEQIGLTETIPEPEIAMHGEITPQVEPPTLEEQVRPRKGASSPGPDNETVLPGEMVTGEKKKGTELNFVLPPLEESVPRGKGKKKLKPRKLAVDTKKNFSKADQRELFNTGSDTSTPHQIDRTVMMSKSVNELMTTPSSLGNFRSRNFLAFYHELCLVSPLRASDINPENARQIQQQDNITSLTANDTMEMRRDHPTLNSTGHLPNMSNVSDILYDHNVTGADEVQRSVLLPAGSPAVTRESSGQPSRKRARFSEGDLEVQISAILPDAQEELMMPPMVEELPPFELEEQVIEEQRVVPETVTDVWQPPSIKAYLTRFLTEMFESERKALLHTLLKKKKVDRLIAAQVFYSLLVMTKRKHIVVYQEVPFGPIDISKGSRWSVEIIR